MKTTTSLLCFALLGALTNAIETADEIDHENNFEHEQLIVDLMKNYAENDAEEETTQKFASYVHHLGTPAMHSEVEDGKLRDDGSD